MKVLTPGRAKSWSRTMKCTGNGNGGGGCGAKLLVEATDVFMTSRHSYGDQYPDNFHTFECVQCKVLTDFPDFTPLDELPSYKEWKKQKDPSLDSGAK